MFFDDVKDYVEVVVEIAKEGDITPIIIQLVNVLGEVLGLTLPVNVFLDGNVIDLARNSSEMNFLKFNSLTNHTSSNDS